MTEEFQQGIVGGEPQKFEPATKGKRMAAAMIDLILIPIVLGMIFGLLLLAAPAWFQTTVLILVNILWVSARDCFKGAGPGKRMVGIKVVAVETGQPITFANYGQAFARNILLIIPVVLFFGYIIETFMILFKGHRICDNWAKTEVVEA